MYLVIAATLFVIMTVVKNSYVAFNFTEHSEFQQVSEYEISYYNTDMRILENGNRKWRKLLFQSAERSL